MTNKISTQIWGRNQLNLPEKIIFPQQTHSINIVKISNGQENLKDCDGIWTENLDLKLGIKTADCAAVSFFEGSKIGIVHAGWRGLVGGIIEQMLENFPGKFPRKIMVAPLLNEFEIQRDDCWEKINNRFGEKYFRYEKGRIIFLFQKALESVLPPETKFSREKTFYNLSSEKQGKSDFYSWRGEKTSKRNITIIGNF